MYNSLLLGAITVSVVITAICINDINNKIYKLNNLQIKEPETVSNISYT